MTFRQHRAPEAWLERTERDGHATREESALSERAWLQEVVMMGLRLSDGIPRETFRRIFAAEPETLLPGEKLDQLRGAGLIILDEARLAVTEDGCARLDGLLAYLFA